MRLNIAIAVTICLLCCSCSSNDGESPSIPMQNIMGRDYEGKRFPVYRARVQAHWIRKDALPEESLTDTTKPLCEFLIRQGSEVIRISVHNFPSETIEQRIPPGAQIARWQRQFETLDPSESGTVPQAFSGYSGFKFKGVGTLKSVNDVESMVLGWALQLSDEHYRTLSYPPQERNRLRYREMRADITIKAVGQKEAMEVNEEEINRFARSIELIEEIPPPS